jgi:N-acetylglutamate synthase-like GNAT family acetyltransferase
LLHGLYVDPAWQHRRIGARLLGAAPDEARRRGLDGLLVKAQPDATGFFQARGMTRLPVQDTGRGYPHRYWRRVAA